MLQVDINGQVGTTALGMAFGFSGAAAIASSPACSSVFPKIPRTTEAERLAAALIASACPRGPVPDDFGRWGEMARLLAVGARVDCGGAERARRMAPNCMNIRRNQQATFARDDVRSK